MMHAMGPSGNSNMKPSGANATFFHHRKHSAALSATDSVPLEEIIDRIEDEDQASSSRQERAAIDE